MPGFAPFKARLFLHQRHPRVQQNPQFGLGSQEIYRRQKSVCLQQLIQIGSNLRRETLQNLDDFHALLIAQLHNLVVQIEDFLRFHEDRLPGGRHVMDEATHTLLVGRSHRNHQAFVAHRHIGIVLHPALLLGQRHVLANVTLRIGRFTANHRPDPKQVFRRIVPHLAHPVQNGINPRQDTDIYHQTLRKFGQTRIGFGVDLGKILLDFAQRGIRSPETLQAFQRNISAFYPETTQLSTQIVIVLRWKGLFQHQKLLELSGLLQIQLKLVERPDRFDPRCQSRCRFSDALFLQKPDNGVESYFLGK